MLNASCCCEKVKLKISSYPTVMGTCYCSRCRKVGASTIVFINRKDLEIVEGLEFIGTYLPEPSYTYRRNFCINCGSSLGEVLSLDDSIPIPANIVDDELELEINFHEFVSEKPKWIKICDSVG